MGIHATRLRGPCLLLCTVVLTDSASSGAYLINAGSEQAAEMRETGEAASVQANIGWLRRLCFPLLTLLATACGSSEASSLNAQASEATPVPSPAESSAALLRNLPVRGRTGAAKPAAGPLRAVFDQAPRVLADCPTGDEKILRILQRDQQIYSRDFCSAYGAGEARLITDARGRHYVFLEHAEGHGTRATSYYLTIYRFANGLDQRAHFLIDEPMGFESNSHFAYEAEAPPGGGIRVRGRWIIRGTRRPEDIPIFRDSAVIEIDTPLTARQ